MPPYAPLLQAPLLQDQCPSPTPFSKAESKTDSVHVCVRVRPAVFDKGRRGGSFRFMDESIHSAKNNQMYNFDKIYTSPSTTQTSFYSSCVSSLVSKFLSGYNATVLAYGQTGSGKTYTMGTGGDEKGVIERVLDDVYGYRDEVAADKDTVTKVKVGFLEVYNEQMRDLLNPTTNPKDLNVREIDGEVVVQNALEIDCDDYEAATSLLREGIKGRITGGTDMNKESSRSHAIFTLVLEKTRVETVDTIIKKNIVRSKFHLVDLAGSERAKRTGANGARLKESVNINQGLLSLGKVIRALSQDSLSKNNRNNNTTPFVPYRESKLTRILQDSLGGNSRTLMVACISPDEEDYQETLNTVVYASQARMIKNKPIIVNRIFESVDLTSQKLIESKLQNEINNLTLKLNINTSFDKKEKEDLTTQIVNLRFASAEAKYRLANIISHHKGNTKAIPTNPILQQLEDISSLLVDEETPMSAVPSPNKALKRLNKKVNDLERDLERDEQIFAAKSKELRALRKHLHKTVGKVKELESELTSMNTGLNRNPASPSPEKIKLAQQLRSATDDYHIQQIQQLEINISVKTEQIQVIEKGRDDAMRLMEEHEQRKRELGDKIERICEEINRRQGGKNRLNLTGDHSQLSVLSDSFDQKEEDDEELENSLENAENELNSLSHQIRDQQRIVSLQKQSVRRIEELSAEIKKMDAERIKLTELSRQFEKGFEGIKRDLNKQIEEWRDDPQPQSGSPCAPQHAPQHAPSRYENKENVGPVLGLSEIEQLRKEVAMERKKNQGEGAIIYAVYDCLLLFSFEY
ncbi:hypothetical protein TL16_g08043 [Triparma laevis f. inornata]|uniref:Kinesin-like protein n=1 Tax=Triparma laevis f. inornata TaxID=1714386 RepID=A0A9W7AWI8_9STRA|nr:hypothetical protein TL16_g08043 [Triparma laevis f. inornata]